MSSSHRKRIDSLERYLQVIVILQVTLAGLLVDVSSHRFTYAPILAAAGCLSLWLTDTVQWIRLPGPLVGVLTLLAVVPWVQDFLIRETYEQLMAVSWLITFWLCVMFFQKKTPKVIGSLIVLSLLLVVISAILTSSMLFAILLVCYQFMGMLSLSLLYAYSGRHKLYYTQVQRCKELAGILSSGNPFSVTNGAPIAYQELQSSVETPGWPRGLWAHVAGLTISTTIFAMGFFYLVPRVTSGGWRGVQEVFGPTVGLPTEISYEETEEIFESNELAFRVSATDANTKTPYLFFEHVYYHGRTFSHYVVDSSGRSAWRAYGRNIGRTLSPLGPEFPGERVRLDFLRQHGKDDLLCYIAAPFAGEGTPDGLRFDQFSSRILVADREQEPKNRPFRYTLYTTAFRDRSQLPLAPVIQYDPRSGKNVYELPENQKLSLLEIDRTRFPTLIATAEQVLKETTPADSTLYRARLLQGHFQDPNRYTYTLDFSEVAQRRNPELDPLEDFVANHRTGHCEYFAGALVLMLRAAGIPARLVVGYVGGEFNPFGNYYQVYQRNAHAWVEAYLEPEEVPQGFMAQAIPPGGAAWYRLDPTPVEARGRTNDRFVITWFDKVLDYAQLLWNTYVVERSDEPSRTIAVSASSGFPFGNHLWERVRTLFWEIPRAFWEDWRNAGFLNWRGGVLAAVGTALLWLVWRWWQALRATVGWLIAWWHRRRTSPRTAAAFYRRLERLLRRYGFRRSRAETPREFIRRVSMCVDGQREPLSHTRQALLELVQIFYNMRFGHVRATPEQSARISWLLAQVRHGLSRWGSAPKNPARSNDRFRQPVVHASRQSSPSGS